MHSRLNRIYSHIKERCYNPNCKDYKDYGARGITVCEEWLEKQRVGEGSKGWYSFRDWALANGYSDELSIDRIDVNNGYSPSNCRWVSLKTQANNRRNNCYITYNLTRAFKYQVAQKGISDDILFALRNKHIGSWSCVYDTFQKNALF